MNNKNNLEQEIELTPRQKELYLKLARGTVYTCLSITLGSIKFIDQYLEHEDLGKAAGMGGLTFFSLLIGFPYSLKLANYLIKKYGF